VGGDREETTKVQRGDATHVHVDEEDVRSPYADAENSFEDVAVRLDSDPRFDQARPEVVENGTVSVDSEKTPPDASAQRRRYRKVTSLEEVGEISC
jgi:hypothetical protein